MISFSQRKKSRQKTIHVSEKQLQKNNKTAHKTRYMHIEITFSGNNKKKSCFSAKDKETMFFYGDFLGKSGKIYRENEKSAAFPESRYVNSNPVLGWIFLLVGRIFYSWLKNFFCPFFHSVFAKKCKCNCKFVMSGHVRNML